VNGAQDLGGMQAFGPVYQEGDEPLFHADWERRVLALTVAMGATGTWNLDMARAARESLPPAQYLASSYYEIWLEGLKKLLVSSGLATAEEIATGQLKEKPVQVSRVLMADRIASVVKRGSPYNRSVTSEARFKVGDIVQTLQIHPSTHTRLPRYCRGKKGMIAGVHGMHVFPDTNAIGLGEQPKWLYTVRFDAVELWGKDTTATTVSVDCWEPYLDHLTPEHT
jgi:nitrile hydratase beta subunit